MNNTCELPLIKNIKYNHMGLIIFSDSKEFKKSIFSTIANYILDWDESKIKNIGPDFDNHLLIGSLYNKSFPVILVFKDLHKDDASSFLHKSLKLIDGVCTHNMNEIIEINNPKVLIYLDNSSKGENANNIETFANKYSHEISNSYFKSSNPMKYEIQFL